MTEAFLTSSILTGLPAVVRIAAIVMTMPIVASRLVPFRVKSALVIAFSILVVPSVAANAVVPTLNPVSVAAGLVNEALIGALMGLSLSVILAGVQLVGTIIQGFCGFSMTTFGGAPDSESGGGPIAMLFWWTTVAVFISTGGLGRVVDGLLDSFVGIPVGTGTLDQSLVDFLVQSLSQAFQFGLSAALPAIAALLVASVVMGMAQRNFPQLGGMQVGLSIKAIFGMVVTSVVLVSAPWIIHDGFDLTLDQMQSLIQQKATEHHGG